MDGHFKKLICYAKKVVVDKKNDDTLEIIIHDSVGDIHTLNVKVKIETTQNIDILGDKLTDYIDNPSLDVIHTTEKSEKISSENISMKWNHAPKPSVFEIRNKEEIVFTGPFTDAMKWASENIADLDQNIVKIKS